jgi:hypothetical protein
MTPANKRAQGVLSVVIEFDEFSVRFAPALDQPIDTIADRYNREARANDRPRRATHFMSAVSASISVAKPLTYFIPYITPAVLNPITQFMPAVSVSISVPLPASIIAISQCRQH